MGDESRSDWLAPLRRQRRRREQRVPTVTLFVGPPGVAEWVWMQWQRGTDARTLAASDGDEVLRGWLAEGRLGVALFESVCERIAGLEGIARAELTSLLAARSVSQRGALVARAAEELELPAAWVEQALGFGGSWAALWHDVPRAVARAAALLGGLPALLVRARTAPRGARELAELLFGVAELSPAAELALAIDESALAELRAECAPRLAAALFEGVILLRPLVPARSREASAVLEYDADAFARSRQEWALHHALEQRSRTRGLFTLNGELRAESGALEVDFLCESLRLAIEVDGYHHFRDAVAYRRDRRKDVQLQELGYLVLRVLASDVEQELDYVLETIDRAVEERQRRAR